MSNMRRTFIASLFLLALVMGCQTAQEQATPTPIPTPIVAEKPFHLREVMAADGLDEMFDNPPFLN